MERGIYFDGWYKNNHCYHPSLPLRSMQMIEDIERYRGTLLVWSALGGGSISLPFLEHEAYGAVDPRLRFYGYMNDKEFIEECGKRGIKVFGIVFEVQGWEFPAAFGHDVEGNVVFKELNVRRDKDTCAEDWYGLREFTQDKHWEVFGKKLKDYFPNGLYNSDGELVTDIWDECCARTYKSEPVHSDWVEVKGHKQIAYQMCRNNPVWREYLKKIMEIQIDAGVQGVQLDECELPMTSIYAGGCFCKDCMKGFREYLKKLKSEGKLSDRLMDEDLDSFHYGEYIVRNNLKYPAYYEDIPLYKYYWDYQLRQIKKYFKELVDYAKDYSQKTRGAQVLVSGNFFTVMPSYFALEPNVDIIITEMKNTLFKQPAWYRYAAGFAKDKSIIIAENPYGGIIPELLEMLNDGKGYDLYRIFLLEASIYGCNMSVPYGGWMGNTIKDAFYPPRQVTMEVQNFLANNERLFSKKSAANVGVVWSYPSYYWREAVAGYSNNVVTNADRDLLTYNNKDIDSPNSTRLPFWEVLKALSDRQICYDVILTADGEMREDNFSLEDIKDYQVLVLPDCTVMTQKQIDAIESFLKLGRFVVIFGRVAENLPIVKEKLASYKNVVFCENPSYKPKAVENFATTFEKVYENYWSIKLSDTSLGLQTHRISDNHTSVHIINYNYNKTLDKVENLPDLKITINEKNIKDLKLYTLNDALLKNMTVNWRAEGSNTEINLTNVPVYLVFELIT